jgi:hypothetical protein
MNGVLTIDQHNLLQTKGDKSDGHHQQVEQIEDAATKRSFVQHQTIGSHFDDDLNSEYSCEEVIKILQYLEDKCKEIQVSARVALTLQPYDRSTRDIKQRKTTPSPWIVPCTNMYFPTT